MCVCVFVYTGQGLKKKATENKCINEEQLHLITGWSKVFRFFRVSFSSFFFFLTLPFFLLLVILDGDERMGLVKNVVERMHEVAPVALVEIA